MNFFPPKSSPEEARPLTPEKGWSAYAEELHVTPIGEPTLAAISAVLAETHQIRLSIRALETYSNAIRFSVAVDFLEAISDDAIRGARDASRSIFRGVGAPSGLLVGVELSDGTRLFSYPTEGASSPSHRLRHVSGGAGDSDGRFGGLEEDYVLCPVPRGKLRIVCSLASFGVEEASVAVPLPD